MLWSTGPLCPTKFVTHLSTKTKDILKYTVKTALVLIRLICLYKEVTIPSGIKVI
jgi:hypothetical protein